MNEKEKGTSLVSISFVEYIQAVASPFEQRGKAPAATGRVLRKR